LQDFVGVSLTLRPNNRVAAYTVVMLVLKCYHYNKNSYNIEFSISTMQSRVETLFFSSFMV
jgi:hypothetical protein